MNFHQRIYRDCGTDVHLTKLLSNYLSVIVYLILGGIAIAVRLLITPSIE